MPDNQSPLPNSIAARAIAANEAFKNKGGRPVGAKAKSSQELKELARSYTPLAIETLVQLIKQKKAPMARLAAISILLDRGYGKPTQLLAGDPSEAPIALTVRRIVIDPAGPDAKHTKTIEG